MVVVNTQGQEINAKIVYYGPALSGKTTNLEQIYERMPSNAKGKMVSMKTRTDRTLFFDFLPIELGNINGYRTRMLLYTVPGQVYYNATRKLVLKGADAVVFIADSSPAKLAENIESLRNLEENLNELGLTLDTLPWVIQYNKRDLTDAVPVQTLENELNLLRVPSFEAVATQAKGVYETFRGIAGLLFTQLSGRLAATEPPAIPKSAAASPGAGVGVPEPVSAAPEAKVPASGPRSPVYETRVRAAETGRPASGREPEAPGVEHSVSSVIEYGLREVDHVAAPSAVRPEAERPADPRAKDRAAAASPRQADAGRGTIPRPSVDAQGDEAFRFASLEMARIDESVGRVLDLDRDADARVPGSDGGNTERDFITDPCRADEREDADDITGSISPVDAVSLGERSPQAEDECVITVPVLLSRSQTRKTIPIKLRLEVQITDDER